MKTYIINLPRRTDRRDAITKHLEEIGMTDYEFFFAYDERPGWRGCFRSHLAVMELCKNEETFLVLEDDAVFIDSLDYIDRAVKQLPSDWQLLSLGASPQEPLERYSENLFRLKNSFCTHGLIWRNGEAVKYILSRKDAIVKYDLLLSREVYPNYGCYLISPLLVTQKQTQSDCCRRSDLSTILNNYACFCK